MICQQQGCMCGITSESLDVSLSGDTFTIESLAFIKVTSLTRPASPVLWQHIFETDTGRQLYWNGSDWVWISGNPPTVILERQSALSVPNGTAENIPFLTEILDTDGFHTGTDHFATIPAPWGGDYYVSAGEQWAANGSGYRAMTLSIGGNPTPLPAQFSPRRVGGSQMENTSNNGFPTAFPYRLEAGATITAQAVQTSGGALDLNFASLTLVMFRHIPSLT